ncbi:small ribosomal subunit protein mS31 isoform X2 [Pyxicephalus adspersus]|uniref:Small ribosomal subunit protein mS31 n=1 Tax=Pyxicephalus adspersus TaxID=30357 RepID=A0AAV3AUD4_PYXAD|nr:TPA: hypothetical protein GDO54_000358 [Pyxicephalus adspersus]
MYRRVVLTLYRGGRGRTAGALTVSRYTDPISKCFSLGSLHCSEKKPPENHVSSDQPAEEKTDAPQKEDSSQPPQEDNLKKIISSMKVEVSSKNRFMAMKKEKKDDHKNRERTEELESASKMFQMASKGNQPAEDPAVAPEIEAAVSAVASTFPNQKHQVASELLQQLRLHKQMADAQRKGDLNIKNVISGMQIQKRPKNLRKQEDGQESPSVKDFVRSQKLFTGKRLQIFPLPLSSEETTVTESPITLWDIELAKQIAAVCEHPPRNGFEEMIQWTNEGKLWTFPIDNEAGLDEEQKVEFHEHVFLDKYLEDFPKQGPIRHFMELVICGLSKNPYFTVQQKKEHIDWFREYFHQKEDVLKECEVYLN